MITVGKRKDSNQDWDLLFAIGCADNTWYELEFEAIGYECDLDALAECEAYINKKLMPKQTVNFYKLLGVFEKE
jgi:hypothetical protein